MFEEKPRTRGHSNTMNRSEDCYDSILQQELTKFNVAAGAGRDGRKKRG
jgi:hypothetical protein